MPPSIQDAQKKVFTPAKRIFGFRLQNIPTINLKGQFAVDREMVLDPELDSKIHAWKFGQTLSPVTVTHPYPDGYFTELLRSTIVGIECTVQQAVIEELLFANRLTDPLLRSIRDPGKLARSMAEAYFNKVPEHLGPEWPLKTKVPDLWSLLSRFYKEVRNPISHGCQLSDVQAVSLRQAFQMFDLVYAWIDSWSDRNRLQKILATTVLKPLM